MMKLNNKGQSLVLFILIIPIILGIMALVIDIGCALTKKNEIDKSIEFVLDYYLRENISNELNQEKSDNNSEDIYLENDSSIDTNALKVLLEYNLKDIEPIINIDNQEIIIKVETNVEGIFSKMLNVKAFKIKSEYKGYLESKSQEKIK